MNTIGIDIGSLSTKVVILNDGSIAGKCIIPTGEDSEASVRQAISDVLKQAGLNQNGLPMVATGIGAKSIPFLTQQKSITTCLSRGINKLFPEVRMAIDMGAESTTVIKINERGKLADWTNQDKCASGTGLFLQQMAKLMAMPLDEMAKFSLQAKSRADITNTCAVFAESEVISHVHRVPPTPREDIVAGIYYSVVSRTISLCKRIGLEKQLAVTGGVARNIGLTTILEKELGFQIFRPEEPQIVAALGAAIIARENAEKGIT